MALNNKILLFLRRTYNRLGAGLAPLRWTLAPELTANKERDLRGYLEHFSEFASREDAIGAAYFLNQIFESGCGLRVETLTRSAIRLYIGTDARGLQELSGELLDVDIRQLSGPAYGWGQTSVATPP